MNHEKVSKYFKVYTRAHAYKIFLDDVQAIYKINARKTPPLAPFSQSPDKKIDQIEAC